MAKRTHIHMKAYDMDTVVAKIREGEVLLIDVREPSEYDAGHLAEAIPAPLSRLEEGKVDAALDGEKVIYVHCKAGVRAKKGAPLLRAILGRGEDEVVALEESFDTLAQYLPMA